MLKTKIGSAILMIALIGALGGCLPQQMADGETRVVASEQHNMSKLAWTDNFMADSCTFVTTGSNPYFVLQPGFQLILEGKEKKDNIHLEITVLNETKKVNGIETRVVEERESKNGKLFEISRNYFAICQQTNSVFYLGEDVDFYDEMGNISGHEGSWLHGTTGARFGIVMPGTILLGSRYFQEIAPGVALDRAEHLSLSQTLQTPAGKFENILVVEETTPLNRRDKSYKFYAPGVGLVRTSGSVKTSGAPGFLELIHYGFIAP